MSKTEGLVLGVGFDSGGKDVATLMVARREKNNLTVINTIRGKDATEIYKKLTNNLEKENNNE